MRSRPVSPLLNNSSFDRKKTVSRKILGEPGRWKFGASIYYASDTLGVPRRDDGDEVDIRRRELEYGRQGRGHAPALIINYSGRFGSRLGNEVIFLPGRRQRRRRRHRRLSLRLRLRRPPSPLSCSRSRRKVFTHVTWPSREIRYAKRQTPSSVYYVCTLSRPISASRKMRVETRSTDAGIYLGKISAVLLFNRESLENTDTRKFMESGLSYDELADQLLIQFLFLFIVRLLNLSLLLIARG